MAQPKNQDGSRDAVRTLTANKEQPMTAPVTLAEHKYTE